MAAGTTYDPIATTTFTSAGTTYTFNSIPSTYTDLVLIVYTKAAVNPSYGIAIQFNSDTGTNYNFNYMYGTGSSTAAASKVNQTFIVPSYGTGVGSGTPSIFRVDINNYSNTTTYKSVISRAENYDTSYGGTEMVIGSWRSTAAISSIKVYAPYGSMTLDTGTMMTLYGITAA
jgi:hypothetical protein